MKELPDCGIRHEGWRFNVTNKYCLWDCEEETDWFYSEFHCHLLQLINDKYRGTCNTERCKDFSSDWGIKKRQNICDSSNTL